MAIGVPRSLADAHCPEHQDRRRGHDRIHRRIKRVPGKTFKEDQGSLKEDQVKAILQGPELSGTVWKGI